ncbi:ATP-binding protein [Nocardioides jensenii]|uniref:ATP-binding protein n=1 Tax=Nocardioides jensenii TaxID=1843 RepID=UPI00248052B5|nr:ATP-binding protein [Nocardioides jensenii]
MAQDGVTDNPTQGERLPLSRGALPLESSPRSVSDARRWVASACRELERSDLVDSAELGVSELVTNALLHGDPPIQVRIRGTRRHPRIEVLDGSRTPPAPNHRMTHEDELLATIGRGLGMVAMSSHAWGAELLDDGKVVWFEPADEPVEEPNLAGQVYVSNSASTGRPPRVRIGDGLVIDYPSFPIDLYVEWRRHFRDVRRELRLLSLAHEEDYPVAKTLTDLFARFGEEVQQTLGIDEIHRAIDAGARTASIRLVIAPEAYRVVEQMIDVLELADSFCRAERMLSLASTDQQRRFQSWFLGELVRQSGGASPLPWLGTQSVDRPEHTIR